MSFVAVSAFATPVPDTGQTGDYTATWGEDSDYDINPHFYTDLDNGIVRDNVTGLEWQQATATGTYSWQQALDYCDDLNLGGHNDWRLPTIKELSTLVDSSIPYPGPTINTSYFPGTATHYYWSSTINVNVTYPHYAWLVDFSGGGVYSGHKSPSYYVRAVRGGQYGSLDYLVSNGDGTVTDKATGLMWQQATAPGTYTWEQGLVYCEALELAGYSDWRLPNRNELQSIVDYSTYSPSIDTTYFPDTAASFYWSSTTNVSNTGLAGSVDFNYGNVGYGGNKSYSYYVRAVRPGQCGSFGDSDVDGICDDGDASDVVGDNPCTGGNTVFCDDNCPEIANPGQEDSDGDGIGDACDPCPYDPYDDADNDGVCGDVDACSGSDTTVTVIVDGCDSGVENQVFDDGCAISDLISECADGAKNRGKFVSCVSVYTNEWKKDGLISGEEKGAIMWCISAFCKDKAYTISGYALQTQRQQLFSFDYNISSENQPISSGILTIEPRGDYTVSSIGEEYLDWDIEGIIQGTGWGPANSDEYVSHTHDDVSWRRSVTIDSSILSSITADGHFMLNIQLSWEVDPYGPHPVEADPYVSWTLEYDTAPIPCAALGGDTDEDGVYDDNDNCPNNCNFDQWDADSDGLGDVCDPEPGCGGCGDPCETEC